MRRYSPLPPRDVLGAHDGALATNIALEGGWHRPQRGWMVIVREGGCPPRHLERRSPAAPRPLGRARRGLDRGRRRTDTHLFRRATSLTLTTGPLALPIAL